MFVERCYLSSTTEHFRIKIEDLFGENISFQKKNLDIYKIRQRRIEGFATDKKDKQWKLFVSANEKEVFSDFSKELQREHAMNSSFT